MDELNAHQPSTSFWSGHRTLACPPGRAQSPSLSFLPSLYYYFSTGYFWGYWLKRNSGKEKHRFLTLGLDASAAYVLLFLYLYTFVFFTHALYVQLADATGYRWSWSMGREKLYVCTLCRICSLETSIVQANPSTPTINSCQVRVRQEIN